MTLRDKYRALLGAFSQQEPLPSGPVYRLSIYKKSGYYFRYIYNIPNILGSGSDSIIFFIEVPKGAKSFRINITTNGFRNANDDMIFCNSLGTSMSAIAPYVNPYHFNKENYSVVREIPDGYKYILISNHTNDYIEFSKNSGGID